jgi:4-diphosphocytidyl-2-C-methyl-D-erythritol kinase
MEETAYAKVNLALHVRARMPDGYHSIETLFAFCEDGDRLSVAEGEGISLRVTGPFADSLETNDNLVLRAARALATRYRVEGGAALLLDKRLPVASGIGGGSADAAAALRLLLRWWGLPREEERLIEIGRDLGADVPACIASHVARGEGKGDQLTIVDDPALSSLPILLLNPMIPLSTADVFKAWDGTDNGALARGPALAAAREGRNDLELPARAIVPAIADILSRLDASDGCLLARMSGSGATCFALYRSEIDRDRAAGAIAAERPDWWQLASRLR